jgi:D-alanyl-D-alanine carboxypeptidase (penicillin-binding protein 5/6)
LLSERGLKVLALIIVGAALLLCLRSADLVDKPALSPPYLNPSVYPDLVYHHAFCEGPAVTARAAILIEASTGTILYAKNEHERREQASITKAMTAIVAIERADLADTVRVSADAARVPGSTLNLSPGQEYKLEELLRATMLRSGNDGATAVAEHIGGSVERFVDLMNTRAATMGLKNTHFANPHGLSAPGHYSTAYDIALMCIWGFRLPKFADIVGCPELWTSSVETGRTKLVYSTNKLLWSLSGADGVKTGTTSKAGHCLAASATRDGLQFIAVVLRSGARFRDAANLLEYGFSTFTRVKAAEAGVAVGEALVRGGADRTVGLATAKDIDVVVRVDEVPGVSVIISVPESLEAPVCAGDGVGWMDVLYEGNLISRQQLYAVDDVRKKSIWER